MTDKDIFFYSHHVGDCAPPQEKWPNKGSLHSEMLPENPVRKENHILLHCILC